MSTFWAIFIVVLYFAPTITAYQRKTKNKSQVVIVNVFLGWTILGWIIALTMSYSGNKEDPNNKIKRESFKLN
jgi:RsiW-degrading membrane proteinase PrsW (M82 family)